MTPVAHSGARAFALIILLATCSVYKLCAAPQDYQGKTIAQIVFEPALQPLPDDELTELLPIKAGEPLDLIKLRTAIVRLFETGRYREISVDAEEAGADVVLRFLTTTTWFVGAVSVEGVPEPPNKGQLVNATNLELGREFTEEQIQPAIDNILQVLRDNGFYEASIERFLDYQPAFSQVNVVFAVEPGPRARFADPVVPGVSSEVSRKIINSTKWKRFWFLPGWKTVTESRIHRGLERIRKSYQNQDYLLSGITLESLEYQPDTRSLVPTLGIRQGPRVQIQTTGAKISKGRLKNLVPVYQEQSADRELLVEGARNLREHFQSKGYFDAEVSFQENNEASDLQTIEYTISTGERYKLVGLEIQGNDYFSNATIREQLSIIPATRLRYRRGRYSEALLNSDLASITALYLSNGFREVKVSSRIEIPSEDNPHETAVIIQIDEGSQWLISDLDLSGVSQENASYVRTLLSSIPGQPFSEANLATDRDNVLDFYYNNGYPNATFDWTTQFDTDPGRVGVSISVSEGQQRFVRASLIGGLSRTDPDMIYNRIQLVPGEPLSQTRIVESQRRLYDLGIFARVVTAVQNPDGIEKRKYMLHQFEEARKYSVNFGFGAQIARIGRGVTDFDSPAGATGFSPRVSFGVSRSNMFGMAHTAALQARISDTRERALLNYLAPQFKGYESLNLSITGLYDFSRDINTFDNTRWEGSVQLRQQLSRARSLQYRFAYRRITLDKLIIDPELVPIFAQAVRVGLSSVGFIQDRRDDPLESTRGYYNAVEAGLASKIFGSETDYLRLVGRNSSYYRVGKDMVVARSLTVGWLINTASDNMASPIPLPERFFSGGDSSHRAFPDNQAGPRDLETGFVVGGRTVFMHNLELRFPLLGDNLSGALFHDAGNVYSKMGNFSLRLSQRDEKDFDYMVHSIGFGTRYRTPIGPVRLDLAYSPNSPRFFGFLGTREELIVGGGERTDQRINRFQFFFSIGQTF